MFERFTDQARRVIVLAQEESRLLGHAHIGTEHILLGLLHEGVAASALTSFGLTHDAVTSQVVEIVGEPRGAAPSAHIPFTSRAKKALELSLREAQALEHDHIGTEHLLLGIIREDDGVAMQALVNLGVEPKPLRHAVLDLMSSPEPEPARVELFELPDAITNALQRARLEARLLGHQSVGTAHLLIGLLGERRDDASELLVEAGVSLADARTAIEETLGYGHVVAPVSIPVTARARDLLIPDLDRPARTTVDAPETVRLLVALLDDADNDATELLDALGVDRRRLRETTLQRYPPQEP